MLRHTCTHNVGLRQLTERTMHSDQNAQSSGCECRVRRGDTPSGGRALEACLLHIRPREKAQPEEALPHEKVLRHDALEEPMELGEPKERA